MKYLLFNRESNKFADILQDAKNNKVRFKVAFQKHLLLGFSDDKVTSLFTLRYGSDIIEFSHIVPDLTPIPGRDYEPERRPKHKQVDIE